MGRHVHELRVRDGAPVRPSCAGQGGRLGRHMCELGGRCAGHARPVRPSCAREVGRQAGEAGQAVMCMSWGGGGGGGGGGAPVR